VKASVRVTRCVRVGGVTVGGGAPVSVQTMATADPHDAAALVDQISRCAEEGADIVRLTVPDLAAAEVFGRVRKAVSVPLVADVHFDYRCALAALEAGADALRLNPGNIGSREHVQVVARRAKAAGVPIRIGVNGGSLTRSLREKFGGATPEALVASALEHVRILEDEGFGDIVISAKASDVMRTLATYRLLAARCDYPLHVGVTEAGTRVKGTVHSSVALGILLAEGIGDTIRVSLTDTPEAEVRVGLEILRALGLRAPGPAVTSCPTCGRTRVDVVRVANEVEAAMARLMRTLPEGRRLPKVAVMGCAVNGPGEAKDADLALCGGHGEFLMFERGVPVGKMSEDGAVQGLLDHVASFLARES